MKLLVPLAFSVLVLAGCTSAAPNGRQLGAGHGPDEQEANAAMLGSPTPMQMQMESMAVMSPPAPAVPAQ